MSAENFVFSCCDRNKINVCDFDLNRLTLTYDHASDMTELNLPRIYNIQIKHDRVYVRLSKTKKDDAVIWAKWTQCDRGEYKIIVYVKVGCPAGDSSNRLCYDMNTILQAIAAAEMCLLEKCPELARTKISVNFRSKDPHYNRVEKWKTLGYWSCCDQTISSLTLKPV